MKDLELKKLEKRQRISFIILLILIFLGAVLFVKTNIYIAIGLFFVGMGLIYTENLNKKMMKMLEED